LKLSLNLYKKGELIISLEDFNFQEDKNLFIEENPELKMTGLDKSEEMFPEKDDPFEEIGYKISRINPEKNTIKIIEYLKNKFSFHGK
jgi:hypothetical protein